VLEADGIHFGLICSGLHGHGVVTPLENSVVLKTQNCAVRNRITRDTPINISLRWMTLVAGR
jgi:hypothetical protein